MQLLIASQNWGRDGYQSLIEQITPKWLCLSAANSTTALTLAREHTPGACLLDTTSPAFARAQTLVQLHRAAPAMRILVLAASGDEAAIRTAMNAGAQGYLLRASALEELPQALKAMREGRSYVSRSLTDALLPAYLRQLTQGSSGSASEQTLPLTPRQQEVLKLIAQGLSTRSMAQHLKVSIKTVETHRADIARRLGISDVAGMTRYALRMGLVSSDG